MKLKCIAVDDESLARRLLAENISQIPFLELTGTCKNAFEAMELLAKEQVDLMFLDIQMPGMLGTKFLESLAVKPMVIFITAYAHYAVESYDLEVVDYLMKPVSLERFTKAAYKALHIKQNASPSLPTEPKQQDSLFLKVDYALVKVQIPAITHIESMKDYVKIFIEKSKKPVITKSTLKGIIDKLPSDSFFRVHNSFVVQLDKIESIRNHQISIGDHKIPVSATHMPALLKSLNQ